MNQSVTTAVFPVAGMGSRFLPITKAGPKEMLPLIDKPLIQYVVEEAISAGIKQLIFVTSSSKRAIEDYFDSNYELENRLLLQGKHEALATVQNIVPDDVSIVYVRQPHPKGLGDAVLCAKNIVGDNPFAVLLADDIIDPGCLSSMVDLYANTQSSVIAVEAVAADKTDQYGIVETQMGAQGLEITSIVEKPKPEDAPSNQAVIGRYILTPRIFQLLESTDIGKGGEVQLTDAIATLLKEQSAYASPIVGTRYDCGSKLGFMQAAFAFAMKRPELREALLEQLSRSATPA